MAILYRRVMMHAYGLLKPPEFHMERRWGMGGEGGGEGAKLDPNLQIVYMKIFE